MQATISKDRTEKPLPRQSLGMRVGSQATLEKADAWSELILASSDTPPENESGPTGSTLHNISSLYIAFGSWGTAPRDDRLLWPKDTDPGIEWAMGLHTLALWCEVVKRRGSTEWQARSLRWKRWPQ